MYWTGLGFGGYFLLVFVWVFFMTCFSDIMWSPEIYSFVILSLPLPAVVIYVTPLYNHIFQPSFPDQVVVCVECKKEGDFMV